MQGKKILPRGLITLKSKEKEGNKKFGMRKIELKKEKELVMRQLISF